MYNKNFEARVELIEVNGGKAWIEDYNAIDLGDMLLLHVPVLKYRQEVEGSSDRAENKDDQE